MKTWRLLLLTLCLACFACDDSEPQQAVEDEWTGTSYAPAASPMCPAPGTEHAATYQQHGGSSNALAWWTLYHVLNADTGRYHARDVHHYHYSAPARVVVPARPSPTPTRPASSWSTWSSTPRPAASKPAGTVTRTYAAPSPSYKAPAPSPARTAPRSQQSYGFKPSTSRPSSTSFRPSFRSSPHISHH